MAATIRVRSFLATRFSSLAALPLIRIEKFTPDLIPIQHRIARITEPFDGYGKIVEVFKVTFDRPANDLRPAAMESAGDRVQCIDNRIRQARGDLGLGLCNVR